MTTDSDYQRGLAQAQTRLARAQTREATARAEDLEHAHAGKIARDVSRTYHFTEVVTDRSVETCMVVLDAWVAHKHDKVTVAFNSPGGSLFSGLGLYDYIRELVEAKGIEVETTCYGYACSMAGILLQAGSVRSMRPNAYMMIHEASTVSDSFQAMSASMMRDQSELIDKLQARTLDILVRRTDGKTSLEHLERKTERKAWWLSADEALRHGFIDYIAYPS